MIEVDSFEYGIKHRVERDLVEKDDDTWEIDNDKCKIFFLEQMLNIAFDALANYGDVGKMIYTKESGCTEAYFHEWYDDFFERDNIRLNQITEQERKNRLRESAISKLTPDERKAIGL